MCGLEPIYCFVHCDHVAARILIVMAYLKRVTLFQAFKLRQ